MCAAELYDYLSSRILCARIALLWILLTAATVATATEPLRRLPWEVLGCALFITAFRLWDDVADLDFDRRHHPQRVLVRATSLICFRLALSAMGVLLIGLVTLLAGGVRALGLLLLVSAFWLLYRIDRAQALRRNWRSVLVLVKYPAFVLLLAADPAGVLTVLAASGVFMVLVLEEARDGGVTVLCPAAALLGAAIVVWLIL